MLNSCGTSSKLYRRRKRPTPRNSGIVFDLEENATALVVIGEVSEPILSVDHHGPELEHLERDASLAHPFLAEKDRAAAIHFDDQGDQGHDGSREHDQQSRDNNVKEPFRHTLPAFQRRGGHMDERKARDLLRVDPGTCYVSQSGGHDETDVSSSELPSQMTENLRMQLHTGRDGNRIGTAFVDGFEDGRRVRFESEDGQPRFGFELRSIVRGWRVGRHRKVARVFARSRDNAK